ncbi:hypothetical protein ACIPUC_14230 [Streptomyces sp. LARHCF249]
MPAYELIRVPLDQVSPTPLNPRRNFGADEEMTRFGEELRQARRSACAAVSRGAYLALWPDHESQVGAASLSNGRFTAKHGLVHPGVVPILIWGCAMYAGVDCGTAAVGRTWCAQV